MKQDLLYICHRVPYPPNKGDKIRTFHEIRFLSRNWNIDLVSFADELKDLNYQPDLERFCRQVFLFPLNPALSKLKGMMSLVSGRSISEGYYVDTKANVRVAELLNQNHYHAVLCFSSPTAEYVFQNLSIFQKRQPVPRLIMDFCDVDSAKWNQYAKTAGFPMSMIYNIESRRLLSYEKRINQQFDASVFVSENEAGLFKTLVPSAKNVISISNGVDFDYFSNPKQKNQNASPPTLMFAGAMDYYANIDGITWFCHQVLPKIKSHYPDIQLMVVGNNPSPDVHALSKISNVQVTGYVADIRDYYRKADVCIIPLRIARGIQNKVLEAMAMEKPVVSTTAAFSGISATPGVHLLVEDTDDAFAHSVITLLGNPELAKSLGRSARQNVMAEYDWDTCLLQLDSVLQ